MNSPVIQDFALSLPLDNNLLHADVIAGTPVDQDEILSLVAISQSLFVTATIESRDLDSVAQCHELWTEVAKMFDELCDSWADIDSDDKQIQWLLARLRHYRDLAQDRVSIYEVTTSQRLRHVETRDASIEYSFTDRHSIEPQAAPEPGAPAYVYRLAPMP